MQAGMILQLLSFLYYVDLSCQSSESFPSTLNFELKNLTPNAKAIIFFKVFKVFKSPFYTSVFLFFNLFLIFVSYITFIFISSLLLFLISPRYSDGITHCKTWWLLIIVDDRPNERNVQLNSSVHWFCTVNAWHECVWQERLTGTVPICFKWWQKGKSEDIEVVESAFGYKSESNKKNNKISDRLSAEQ